MTSMDASLCPQAEQFIFHAKAVTDYHSICFEGNDALISMADVTDNFVAAVMKQSRYSGDKNLHIIYTPLHGTGNVPVQKCLRLAGFNNVKSVAEQVAPDGNFPTVVSPNPEDRRALEMGIAPTYPSDKYGYIILEENGKVRKVKEFREKPDTETAKKYLAQNALRNAGVFAFWLGYLLEKAHSMADFTDYRDLFAKYETLPKISFDYAVVEKEPSIQVVRYNGDWKDVGTWNMMAEVMSDNIKGKAIMDDACENTQIVNELNIPILCMGCKNMVIAASGDGILVSDKERSGYMKPYVEKVSTRCHVCGKVLGYVHRYGCKARLYDCQDFYPRR